LAPKVAFGFTNSICSRLVVIFTFYSPFRFSLQSVSWVGRGRSRHLGSLFIDPGAPPFIKEPLLRDGGIKTHP